MQGRNGWLTLGSVFEAADIIGKDLGRHVVRRGSCLTQNARRTNRNSALSPGRRLDDRLVPGSVGAGSVAGATGDEGDIAAGDAEVVEFAFRHAGQFVDRVAVVAPVLVSLTEVHGLCPFRFRWKSALCLLTSI